MLSIIFLLANFNVVSAVTCAPGDVGLDAKNNVATGGAKIFKCLYGSDVAENKGLGSTISDPKPTIRIIINVTLGFLGIVVVVMIIYGGFLWLTSAGQEERVTKGKHTLVWAAIGALVISIAWTITSYILQLGRAIG